MLQVAQTAVSWADQTWCRWAWWPWYRTSCSNPSIAVAKSHSPRELCSSRTGLGSRCAVFEASFVSFCVAVQKVYCFLYVSCFRSSCASGKEWWQIACSEAILRCIRVYQLSGRWCRIRDRAWRFCVSYVPSRSLFLCRSDRRQQRGPILNRCTIFACWCLFPLVGGLSWQTPPYRNRPGRSCTRWKQPSCTKQILRRHRLFRGHARNSYSSYILVGKPTVLFHQVHCTASPMPVRANSARQFCCASGIALQRKLQRWGRTSGWNSPRWARLYQGSLGTRRSDSCRHLRSMAT